MEKTKENIVKIKAYLREKGILRVSDIAEYIILLPVRTKVMLSEMIVIKTVREKVIEHMSQKSF